MLNIKEQNCHPAINMDMCIWCGECVNACPNNVIEISGEGNYIFSWYKCDCTEKCKDVCPVGAIYDIND